MRAIFAIFVSLLALCALGAAPLDSPLHLRACTVGKSKLPAHCGTLRVYENRDARAGRTIEIHFTEVDAEHRTNRALFFNPGGPGVDTQSYAAALATGEFLKPIAKLRASYDLVFIDNRGTGASHALQCDLFPKNHPDYYYKQLWPDQLLRQCRAQLSKSADLSMYTTDLTVADIDDIRAALHYPKVVFYGGSYGTQLYLDYARRFPAHVESMVLEGVMPTGFLILPLQMASGGQKAMDDLIADCSKDAVCHSHFPQFSAHFNAVVHGFDRGPIAVTIVNPGTKRRQSVLLSKEVFADRMRDMLYESDAAAYVPYIIEQAYQRNYVPVGRAIEVWTDGIWRGQSIGLNLSVTCAEDIPFITEAQIAKASAGSFIGDTRVRAQQHACSIWNVKPVSSSYQTPVRSTVPILMTSGQDDPATPPELGREALRYLPNGHQIIIPHAGHDQELACEDDLIVQFVRTRNAKALDANACAASSKRPPFMTSMKDFP